MDNSESRLQEVFFYGLYMDPEILKSKGVEPRNPRIAAVKGYKLRIGNMATLLRSENSEANGVVYSLTPADIDTLYSKSGLEMYVSEAIMVTISTGETLATLTRNLLVPPEEHESNPEYREKLNLCMEKLNVPTSNV